MLVAISASAKRHPQPRCMGKRWAVRSWAEAHTCQIITLLSILMFVFFPRRELSFRLEPKKCIWKCQWDHYLGLELQWRAANQKTGRGKYPYGFAIVVNVNQYRFMATIQNRAVKMDSVRTALQFGRSRWRKVEPKNERGGLVSSEWFTIGHSISTVCHFFFLTQFLLSSSIRFISLLQWLRRSRIPDTGSNNPE